MNCRAISHRGNLNGPTDQENNPQYIQKALDAGFAVEVDVWVENGKWYFGHDYAQYDVKITKFLRQNVLLHLKIL